MEEKSRWVNSVNDLQNSPLRGLTCEEISEMGCVCWEFEGFGCFGSEKVFEGLFAALK
jgi:hypothetical protein